MSKFYDHIYILGGHELGFSYYEKLKQHKKEGKLICEHIYVVDPNDNHFAKTKLKKGTKSIIQSSYAQLIQDKQNEKKSVIIPDHTAKHVFLQVFIELANQRGYQASLSPIEQEYNLPYVTKLENNSIFALSYATWMCPMYCDEPAICPHTKKKRTWDLGSYINHNSSESHLYSFACEPIANEIVCIPLDKIANEMTNFEINLKTSSNKEHCVFTHSHCHGILGCFRIV